MRLDTITFMLKIFDLFIVIHMQCVLRVLRSDHFL